MSMQPAPLTVRHTPSQLQQWRSEGGVLIESFFTPDEVAAVVADFAQVFPTPTQVSDTGVGNSGPAKARFNKAQFSNFAAIPFDASPALNLIGLHPALIALAQDALGTPELHLYQCQAWAKFTGLANYEQPFHCDFANHTLTVPSTEDALNSITIICYFSDVTEAHGPMHYVKRSASAAIAGPEASFAAQGSGDDSAHQKLQQALANVEESSAAPAGSIFPYGIDVYHRGTNMTAPSGHRYAVMACFKAAANSSVGYHAWPFHHLQPWHRIFAHASPQQLACLGVHPPGHEFWNQTTLARAQARYPDWDLTPYVKALNLG